MSFSHFFSKSNQSSSVQTEHVRDKGSITKHFFPHPPKNKRCQYLGMMSRRTLILLVWGQGVTSKTDTAFPHLLYNVASDVLSCVMELTRLNAMCYYWWWMPLIYVFLSHYPIHLQNMMDSEKERLWLCYLPGFVLRLNISFGSLVEWIVLAKFTLAIQRGFLIYQVTECWNHFIILLCLDTEPLWASSKSEIWL